MLMLGFTVTCDILITWLLDSSVFNKIIFLYLSCRIYIYRRMPISFRSHSSRFPNIYDRATRTRRSQQVFSTAAV